MSHKVAAHVKASCPSIKHLSNQWLQDYDNWEQEGLSKFKHGVEIDRSI